MTFGYPKKLMFLLLISTVQSTQNKYCTVCCMLFLCRLPNRFFKTPIDVRTLHHRPSKITCGHIKILLPKGNSLKIVTHWHCLMILWYQGYHDKLYTEKRTKKKRYQTLAKKESWDLFSPVENWRSKRTKPRVQSLPRCCRCSPWCSLGLRLSPI